MLGVVGVLDTLLESGRFDPGRHPRDWHGRWASAPGGKVYTAEHRGATIKIVKQNTAAGGPRWKALHTNARGEQRYVARGDNLTAVKTEAAKTFAQTEPTSHDRIVGALAQRGLRPGARVMANGSHPAEVVSVTDRGITVKFEDGSGTAFLTRGTPGFERTKVRESESAAVLGVLLEGFDVSKHPRGYHGHWIGTTKDGSAALRVMHGDTHIGDVPHNENRTQMMIGVGRVVGAAGRTISTGDIGRVVDHVRRSLPPSGEPTRKSPIDPSSRGASSRDVDNSLANQRRAAASGLRFGRPAKIPGPARSRESESSGVGLLLEGFAPPAAPAPAETPAQSQARGAAQVAAAQKQIAGWNAQKHPRGPGGKFGYTTGGKRAVRAQHTSTRVVTTGAQGSLVKAIQKQLGLPASGTYDQHTLKAVERYQTQHGLQVDGVVGRQTLAAMRGNPNARGITPGPIAASAAAIAVHPSRRATRAGKASRSMGGTLI